MTLLTAFGVVEGIRLSKRADDGKILRECALGLVTETGRLVVFFNGLDDSASDPGQQVQRSPAMVELLALRPVGSGACKPKLIALWRRRAYGKTAIPRASRSCR